MKSLKLLRWSAASPTRAALVLRRFVSDGGSRSNAAESEKYTVVKIDNNGVWETLSLSMSQLKIHPRDMDVLVGNSFIPRRATIAPRYDKILVRMENVRALVMRDSCYLFDTQKKRRTKEAALLTPGAAKDNMRKASRDAFATVLAAAAKQNPVLHIDGLPFHLRVLECLFEDAGNYFNQKVERLAHVAERALEDLSKSVSTGGLRRLLPLKRAITEVEHDIRDTHEVLDQVLSSEDTLRSFCLEGSESLSLDGADTDTEKQNSKVRRLAADMLFTYLKEIDDAGAVLEELTKEMDAAQEVWELGLDATRNRIMSTNLHISFATLSVTLATVPSSFFGMNLPSGWEADPTMFKIVAGTTLLAATSLGAGLVIGFRVWPRIVDKRSAQDHAALLDLLEHIDDIEDIFRDIEAKAGGKDISKQQFQEILRSHGSLRFMRQRELDYMFDLFDKNRDGFLEAYERRYHRHL